MDRIYRLIGRELTFVISGKAANFLFIELISGHIVQLLGFLCKFSHHQEVI